MAFGDPKICDSCGSMITFVRAPSGNLVPCNWTSVKVVPDKRGHLFYLGEGKAVWGREVKSNHSGAITAWVSHRDSCSKPMRKRSIRPRKKTKDEIKQARIAAKAEEKRVIEALIVQREKEWEAARVL